MKADYKARRAAKQAAQKAARRNARSLTAGSRKAATALQGRNEICACGSGKKYKKCCEKRDELNRPKTVLMENDESLTYTRADEIDFEAPKNLADHEAAHAVAFWIMGVPLDYIQLNDYYDAADKQSREFRLAGETVATPLQSNGLTVGELAVLGRQHAFITLAGVFGSGDATSDNPLRQYETKKHISQAGSKLALFGYSQGEARKEVMRLIGVVVDCFGSSVMRSLVSLLAFALLKKRRLGGDEVQTILNAAYPAYREAADPGIVAVLREASSSTSVEDRS
jgi:hypothetical protein